MTVPIWVIAVFFGILFSAYMTVKSVKEEEAYERNQIKKEGEIYMHRLREEKKKNKVHFKKAKG